MLGCTNPAAENYNPSATEDNGTCVYLVEMNGQCLEFGDVVVESVKDKSFTLSFDTEDNQWSFFHDYFADFYIHTRKSLYSLKKGNRIYQHNKGPRGKYYDEDYKPFIIDLVFKNKETFILNSVNWISEVRDNGTVDKDEAKALYNETITSITIWNNYQTTGRILLTKNGNNILPLQNNRNSEQSWNFNEFRNAALENVQFLQDIFNNFNTVPGTTVNYPWYKAKLMEGKYFIVRFEFANNNDKQITIHDVDINASQSYR